MIDVSHSLIYARQNTVMCFVLWDPVSPVIFLATFAIRGKPEKHIVFHLIIHEWCSCSVMQNKVFNGQWSAVLKRSWKVCS